MIKYHNLMRWLLCTLKPQDMVDGGKIFPDTVSAGTLNSTPIIVEFGISAAGILKFLKNLEPSKATALLMTLS